MAVIETPEEAERRKRICVALWAYAYEIRSASMVSDARFDEVCQSIDLAQSTGHAVLDAWFAEHFQPHTGQWIHSHPELDKVAKLYERRQKGDAYLRNKQ